MADRSRERLRSSRTRSSTSLSLRPKSPGLRQPAEVMQGTLDLLILKALSLAPMHGWGISRRIQQMSGDAFRIGQGSLYPALYRFEDRGWVLSYWQTSENNRVARYYQLTAAGRRALNEEIGSWRAYTDTVNLVVDAQ
jgi:PadR family transcriptional regulator PadR